MWKHISGVPKIVEEKKGRKKLNAACDSKEYEKNRTRKFSVKWQVGQPWLQHHDKGMVCEWCIKNKQTNFGGTKCVELIDGCTSYKEESIS